MYSSSQISQDCHPFAFPPQIASQMCDHITVW